MKKAKIISVHIQKGGAGKTTTTSFLGGELAARGFKVLLLDTDKQKNLTVNYRLKFEEDDPEKKGKTYTTLSSIQKRRILIRLITLFLLSSKTLIWCLQYQINLQ